MSGRPLETLALSLVPGMGPLTHDRLVRAWGSARSVLEAGPASLEALGPKDRKPVRPQDWPSSGRLLEQAAREAALCRKEGIEWFARGEPDYPQRLEALHDPPMVVYVKGRLDARRAVAIVGSRRATIYGRRVATRMAGELAEAGLTVVSGMALGIDGCAHEAALAAAGKTVAVLGGGLGRIYPRQHEDLARRIAASGALVSERPYEQEARAGFFPVRNRILAALADAVVVVEAARASGSLITADAALELGRDVCAVPGNVDSPASEGTNRLIRQGASPVTSASDVLEVLGCPVPDDAPARRRPGRGRDARLLSELSSSPLHVDELADASGMDASEVLAGLSRLELDGSARRVGGQRYVKA